MGKTVLVVFVTITKILGIILLVLLLLLMLLLFAAVRYRIDSRLESRMVKGCVSWLGFVVRVPFRSENGDVKWRLQILGIPIMSSRKKSRRKSRKKWFRGKKAEKSVAKDANLSDEAGQEETPETPVAKDDKTHTVSGEDKKVTSEQSPAGTDGEQPDTQENRQGMFGKFFQKRRQFREKSKSAREQLTTWMRTMRELFRTAKKKTSSVQDLKEILNSDHGKAFICIGKENVLHLLRQLSPRKVKGDIIFGTGDPCTTGEILGLLSVFYAWVGTGIRVTPDFMEKRLEGRIQMWGRIRIFNLLRIALRIIWNKEGKKLQKELQKWKEDF